ncbi:NADH-quinone oxidoreductase subunit M [Methylobacter svalbardensis]|uniref:complex I subunit 4 family protein n=1 Tax=Methylobacter svalbardensis TaxID=3080016 RepID=UPI0030ED35AA
MDITVTPWSESVAFPLLTTLTAVPLLAMIAILFSRSPRIALRFGFAGALLTVLLSLYLLTVFDSSLPGIHLVEQLHFAGLSYRVGVDGTNILFIPLTAILTLLALIYTLITRHVTDRLFIACLLGYETILIGAFVALNVLQFWFWCVLELIPVVLLTVHAGTGQKRRWVVVLLLQYWVSGLLLTLAGFLLLAFGLIDSSHALTFDWVTLKQNNAYLHDEVLIFILLFFGFAIRMPLFPFHGWLPVLAEQGTVASAVVFLVGLKLGIYAAIRFILPMVPGVVEQWAGFVVTLGLISIFYGALLALMQINIRRLLAFAVISQTGMLVIGAFCFNANGLEGSLLLSVAYGLAMAGMLFSIGLIYERTRTAFIPRLGGLFNTNGTLALLFLLSALSTMVMPGTTGFDAAHLLVEGIIEEYGWLLAIAILVGNLLSAAFLLWAFQRIFMAASKRAVQPYSCTHHPVKTERIIAAMICLLLIGTGFYTTPWLNFIDQDAAEIGKQYPMHGVPSTDDNDQHE